MTSSSTSSPPMTRKKTISLLRQVVSGGGTDSEVIDLTTRIIRSCQRHLGEKGCGSPLCPDCLQRRYLAPINRDLASAFSEVSPRSLVRLHLRLPGLVRGDYHFRRSLLQLREAFAEFIKGAVFSDTIAYAGLVHPRWVPHPHRGAPGFSVSLRLLCRIRSPLDTTTGDPHWRVLLMSKSDFPFLAWGEEKALVTAVPVRSVASSIDVVTRYKHPLPANLDLIPARAIVEVFGYPKLLYHVYGRKTL